MDGEGRGQGAGEERTELARRVAELEELARVGSWEWNVATDTITWSDEMFRIFGVKPDAFEATYDAYLACLHPDDRALARHNVERALHHHEQYEADYRAVWPTGEIRWLHCRGRALVEDDGTVSALIGTSQDITDRKNLESALTQQALHDPLTGLPNRLLLLDRLEHALARVPRAGGRTAVLFVDLDRFKAVNDGAGHAAGDEVLRVIAARLRTSVRAHDTVARYGGDEFVVIGEDLRWPQEAALIAERLLVACAVPVRVPSGDIRLSASVGGTVAVGDEAPDDLLRNADAAMYQAKSRGGDTIAWVDLTHESS